MTITECQALCFHQNHTDLLFCLWISRLAFADFTVTKANYSITTKSSICHHVPYIFFFTHEAITALSCCAPRVHFHWLTAQRKMNFITSIIWNESHIVLWAERALGASNRGCLCCQSKAEQWLRLISILMNANWHICYGGLAVQTLQLAWLINYPPAGGSLEMGSGWGRRRRGCRGRKRDERAWGRKKKEQKSVQNPHSTNLILYLIRGKE